MSCFVMVSGFVMMFVVYLVLVNVVCFLGDMLTMYVYVIGFFYRPLYNPS